MRHEKAALLDLIVRRFPRDDYIVDMAFAQARNGYAHESRLLLQFRQRPVTRQAADMLQGIAATQAHEGHHVA